jgi:hypothetical protein
MRKKWILRGAKIVAIGTLAIAVFTFVVMSLWNALVPALFAGPVITFWQALGLLLLSKILFGGFRGPGRHPHWRHRMRERLEQMTPEERENFRKSMRERCSWSRKPAEETQ